MRKDLTKTFMLPCAKCGKRFRPRINDPEARFCSRKCQGDAPVMAGGVSYSFVYTTCASSSLTFAPWPLYRTGIPADLVQKLRIAQPRKVPMRVPDLTEPIVAWRAWRVAGARLTGLGLDSPWLPGRPNAADCQQRGFLFGTASVYHSVYHSAPNRDCTCGIWAFKSLEALIEASRGYDCPVFGEVYLWGRVLECGEHGWRAEYAYPKELWLTDPKLEHLGATYNVPVRL